MKVRDWFIVLFTMAAGVVSGIYFYITNFKPYYEEDTLPQSELQAAEFSVIGVTYGGFTPENYIHPSFRVKADRTYDYFPGGTTQADKQGGELPKRLFIAITEAVAESDLDALATPVPDKSCASFADGLEYEYSIEIKGTEHTLDTCLTAFSNDTALGEVLLEVWKFTDKPDEYRFSVTNMPDEDGGFQFPTLRGYLEKGLKESGFDE